MEVADILAEDGEEVSEGGTVVRVTPATSVEGPGTGPSTARDEVIQSRPHTPSQIDMNLCELRQQNTKEKFYRGIRVLQLLGVYHIYNVSLIVLWYFVMNAIDVLRKCC